MLTTRVEEHTMITEPVLTKIKIKIKTRHDIHVTGDPDVAVDRYLIDSAESNGLISAVEQEFAPGVLAEAAARTDDREGPSRR